MTVSLSYNFSNIGQFIYFTCSLVARALIIDGRHFLTFDKRFVTIDDCKSMEKDTIANMNSQRQLHILAHEFSQSNFTLLLETIKVNILHFLYYDEHALEILLELFVLFNNCLDIFC